MGNTVHASDFNCESVLRFLEHCNSCPKAGKCKERGYLKTIINGKKKISYKKR